VNIIQCQICNSLCDFLHPSVPRDLLYFLPFNTNFSRWKYQIKKQETTFWSLLLSSLRNTSQLIQPLRFIFLDLLYGVQIILIKKPNKQSTQSLHVDYTKESPLRLRPSNGSLHYLRAMLKATEKQITWRIVSLLPRPQAPLPCKDLQSTPSFFPS